jgi:hypothetical protein
LDVSSFAPACPYCGVSNPGRAKITPLKALAIGIGLLLMIGVAVIEDGIEASSAAPTTVEEAAAGVARRTRSAVQSACQEWVRLSLKAPSTAKFQREGRETGPRIGADSTLWISRGFVDAQNSFGAQLRNRYECVARVEPRGISAVSVTVE